MTDEEKKKIDEMSQLEMARLIRFAQVGDKIFQGEMGKYFGKVFQKKGGMTPKISKQLGW